MPRILLFTQCLQNDFVAPVAAGGRIPNQLHIGHTEARRLVGDDPAAGPLGRFLRAFYAGAGPGHAVVHVRDWHDAGDPAQQAHLAHFGPHCLRGSGGASFVPPLDDLHDDGVPTRIVDSTTLNDFVSTGLETAIRELLGPVPPYEAVAGIIGVWTDVKVQYLAYDLITRLGFRNLVVCSALTASRSRIRHFQALDLLSQNLAVRVVDGIPEFLASLGIGERAESRPTPAYGVVLSGASVEGEDADLVRHLFRSCRSVELSPLAGGFSGARVWRTRSIDQEGRIEVPFVVKTDERAKIAKERAAVERVENVLGLSAPTMIDHADMVTRGAIQYMFASMHHSPVTTLQRKVAEARSPEEVTALLRRVWSNVLCRLSQSPVRDRLQLYRHYGYRPEYAANTLERGRALAGGIDLAPLRDFYARLPEFLSADPVDAPVAWVHGDLNLANVLLDDAGNSWLIDYFHTGPAHALKDAAKLENDLKFILHPVPDEDALQRALQWEDILMRQESIDAPPPSLPRPLAADPAIARTHAAVCEVRGWAKELCAGVTAMDGYRVALLRYSAHTTGFEECDRLQRRHALGASVSAARRLCDS